MEFFGKHDSTTDCRLSSRWLRLGCSLLNAHRMCKSCTIRESKQSINKYHSDMCIRHKRPWDAAIEMRCTSFWLCVCVSLYSWSMNRLRIKSPCEVSVECWNFSLRWLNLFVSFRNSMFNCWIFLLFVLYDCAHFTFILFFFYIECFSMGIIHYVLHAGFFASNIRL